MDVNLDPRRNNVDAVRLILAVLVVFSHSFPLATGSEEHEPLSWASRGQATLGGLAVDWFFVLSGLLISQSWERSRSAGSFFARRLARIFPGYLAAVAFCGFVVVPIAGGRWPGTIGAAGEALALRGLRVPEAFARNPVPGAVNGSLWSIAFEFWCYVGVMGLGALGMLRRRQWLLAALVGLVAAHLAFEVFDYRPGGKILGRLFGVPRIWARLAPFYLAGILLNLFRDRLPIDRRWAIGSILGLAIACRIPHGLVVALPTLGSYLLLYLCMTTDWRWHDAASRGDFSYGISLYAFPIQQLIVMAFDRPISPVLLFGLAIGPTTLLAFASWHLVERRALLMVRRGRKASGRSPDADPSPAVRAEAETRSR